MARLRAPGRDDWMTTYEQCGTDVHGMVERLVLDHHEDLRDANVTFALLFAHADVDDDGEPKGPALVLRGHACAAIARIVNLKDRAKGVPDAEIVIDGDAWDERTPGEQKAVLDHELTHFRVRKDGEVPLRDDLKRPLLRMRLHDVELGWFAEVAQRHQEASLEVIQAQAIVTRHGQTCFPFLGLGDGESGGESKGAHRDRVRRAAAAKAATPVEESAG